MILVAVVAELLEQYTALVAHALEQLLEDAPFPRRVRFLILRSLPFTSPPQLPPPPPHALRVRSRAASRNNFYYNTTVTGSSEMIIGRKKMTRGKPLSLQAVELKVRMCCAGCERVVKHALLKLRGVDSVEVELEMQKVTVTGYVDRNKVLKEVRRSGKKAQFWPNPHLPLFFTTAKDYFHDDASFRDSYNYWRHGYNGDKHGHVPPPHRGDARVSNMFNDDDVNACAVM